MNRYHRGTDIRNTLTVNGADINTAVNVFSIVYNN